MYFKNNRGFTLVEMMVAGAILGGLSLLVVTLTQQSTKSTAKMELDSDTTLTTNEINAILSNPANCFATFNGDATPESIRIANPASNRYYIKTNANAPATGYGNSGLKITSYTLTAINANIALLTILYENKNIVKGNSGRNDVIKTTQIYYEGPSVNAITMCRSLATSTTDIWSHGPGSDIFYAGNVGFGVDAANNPKQDPVFPIDVFGTVQATTFIYASDKRLKKNIVPIENALEKILAIRGVSFNWREDNRHDVGLIAQEVQKQIPEVVKSNDVNDRLGVDYIRIVPFLVEAIKKQQTEINELKKEIRLLKN